MSAVTTDIQPEAPFAARGLTRDRSAVEAEPVGVPEGGSTSRTIRVLPAVLVLGDMLSIGASVGAAALALGYEGLTAARYAVVAASAVVLTVAFRRGYGSSRITSPLPAPATVARAIGVVALGVVVLSYTQVIEIPVQFLLAAGGASVAAALAMRGGTGLVVSMVAARAVRGPRVIMVGPRTPVMDELVNKLEATSAQVLGRLANGERGDGVLGDISRLPALVRELEADTVVLAADVYSPTELQEVSWLLESMRVKLLIAPAIAHVEAHRVGLEHVGGTPLVSLQLGPRGSSRLLKAVIDRSLGVLIGVASLFVLVPAMILVKATSAGPVFFRQTRVGTDGVPFSMVKLRSMHVDAEARLATLVGQSDGNVILFKMRKDPRITPVGRVLRRFSIDELPQIWNVIRGDMSLVGPRPPLPHEVANYDDRAYHRLAAKPVLTGLWQVSGRSDLDWDESINLDLHYVDNRAIRLDAKILAKTAGAVLGGRGAY